MNTARLEEPTSVVQTGLLHTLNSHILEIVEPGILILIVPLNGADLVEAVDGGQSVDDMCAQEWVDVVCSEFGTAWPVLGPVGHVANQFVG